MNKRKESAKQVMNRFEDAMSAAAFAEAGEFETAKKLFTARHRILLVLTGRESDMNAAQYALNISERINAGIEILYLNGDGRRDSFLEAYLRKLRDRRIEHSLTERKGSVREEIIKFTDKASDIQFVVIDSEISGAEHEKEGTVFQGWERLECPLVLVSDMAKA